MKIDRAAFSTLFSTTALVFGLLLAACGCADLDGGRARGQTVQDELDQDIDLQDFEAEEEEDIVDGRGTNGAHGGNAGIQPAAEVVINGRKLGAHELADFRARYGTEPGAGRYWYDSRCGLWGREGAAASGFIFPGHDFGRLSSQASAGSSSIFLNGREMPQGEVLVFQALLGSAIWPGRYWLDAYGNYGYEGVAFAAGNLYAVMAARGNGGGRGGSGGGDNYWSTRYAAGNCNADNSAGYVYIPGTGSVSYGL